MDDEKYSLNDWERMNIISKSKLDTLSQLVSQTILSLRCYLIKNKVGNFKAELAKEDSDNRAILEDVQSYNDLKKLLSRKLGKVLG